MMFSQDSTLIGDVDCSGEVNSQDASLILQFVTNVIDELPCEANMTGLTPEQLQEIIDMMEDQLNINYIAGSGGGCDYMFPDGLDGEPVIWDFSNGDYSVPLGKNLYVVGSTSWDYKVRYPSVSGDIFSVSGGQPLILDYNWEVIDANDEGTFHGFLVSSTVSPVIWDFSNGDYSVPLGKNLYVVGSTSWDYKVRYPSVSGDIFSVSGGQPLILDYNWEVIDANDEGTFHGYLVDEDYFADCSGGGGSTLQSNSSTVNPGVLTANDFCIEVDAVISMDIEDPILNDLGFINSVTMDSLSNIYIAIDIGWLSSNSIIRKYDSDLNLIWSISHSGNVTALKYHNNSLYMSGKQNGATNPISDGNDFVSKVDLNSGAIIWQADLSIGDNSYGNLLECNNNDVVFVTRNGNNGGFYYVFDSENGEYNSYGISINAAQKIAINNNILYIGTSTNQLLSYNLLSEGEPVDNDYSFQNNDNITFSNSQYIKQNFNSNSTVNLSIGSDLSYGFVVGNTLNSSFNSIDYIKPNDLGFSYFLTFSDHIVNYKSQAVFENLSNSYGYVLMDLDMNLNLINVKSFSSLVQNNYDSFKFHISSSGKRVVAIKTNVDGGGVPSNNQICINGEVYSGYILMIY